MKGGRQMRGKSLVVAALLLTLLLTGVACRSYQQENAALAELLPANQGYRWVYSGFAEYGHSMELVQSPVTADGKTVYTVTGKVDDMSGGEAPGPFDFQLTYTIAKGQLSRSLSAGSKLMDNRFPELVLVQAPLTKGNSWTQQVQDKSGQSVKLSCTIKDVTTEHDQQLYRVRYEDAASGYWEERVFAAGGGMVSVELPFEQSSIGYWLYDAASGYAAERQLKALLPPQELQLRYFGLAEYGHVGKLALVSHNATGAVAEFTADFEDGSGLPGEFKVQYLLDYASGQVTEKVISNSRTGQAQVNSQMHDPIILKLPLEVGNSWDQTVTVGGSQHTMHAQIVETTNAWFGRQLDDPVIRVRYTVPGVTGYFRDTYLEERLFLEGWGMIGFSNLLPGDIGLTGDQLQNEQLVQEAIIQHMFGYSLDLPQN